MDHDITIYWIRHGESTAQMMENAIDDAYDEYAKDAEKKKIKFQNYRKEVKQEEIENYQHFEPELKKAYDDLNQEEKKNGVLTSLNVWDPNDEHVKKYIESKNSDKKDKKDEKYFKYGKFTPASWFFTPTLTWVGKLEAEQLGTNFLNVHEQKENTLFICSPTVRTIMTALYSLVSAGLTSSIIYIIPHINEMGMENKDLDRANAGIPVDIIDKVITLIKTSIDKAANIQINTDIYIEAYKSEEDKNTFYLGNFEKAQKYIIEKAKEHIIKLRTDNIEKTQIMAYVHANFIDKRIKEATTKSEFPINCYVYKIQYKIQDESNVLESKSPAELVYKKQVRKNDVVKITPDEEEKHIKFSSLAADQLRGKINRLWIDPKRYEMCYDKNDDYKCSTLVGSDQWSGGPKWVGEAKIKYTVSKHTGGKGSKKRRTKNTKKNTKKHKGTKHKGTKHKGTKHKGTKYKRRKMTFSRY